MNTVTTLLSRNQKRSAMICRSGKPGDRWMLTLTENRKLGNSLRQRTAPSKPEAIKIARAWVGR